MNDKLSKVGLVTHGPINPFMGVCLVGVPYVFQQMVDNAMEQKRYSGLRDRIEEIMETL